MKTEKIYTRHEENTEWMNNLLFYNDEIKIMRHRLEEIASKNTSKEILAKVEHFQNQLIVQRDAIDTLKHGLNLDNDAITREITKNDVALEHRHMRDHSGMRDGIASFEAIFKSLKTELNAFLSQWM